MEYWSIQAIQCQNRKNKMLCFKFSIPQTSTLISRALAYWPRTAQGNLTKWVFLLRMRRKLKTLTNSYQMI